VENAIVIAAFSVVFAAVIIVRAIRLRRFRAAAAPVGAAASVLRNAYSGNGTEPSAAADLDRAQPTSITLDGDDPLRVHGVRFAGFDTVAERRTQSTDTPE